MTVSEAMKTHLRGTSTLAVFIKITAKDGAVVAVTNATRNKIIDGVTYFSVPLAPSQLQVSNGLKADNIELVTVLGGLYTAATLRAQKWFGAKVEYAVYNYKDFSMGPAEKRVGYVGETEVGKYTAKPELVSLSNKLTQPVGNTFLQTCNVASLGDARCGFNLSGNTADGYRARTTAQVASRLNRQQFTVSFTQAVKPAEPSVTIAPDDLVAFGEAEFTSGNNSGLVARVLASAGNAVTLWLPTFYDIAVGNTLILTVGCNRAIEQCVSRFQNGANNRSFWTLPGRSKLFKIPE